MVDFVYGRTGTGKSAEILRRASNAAKDGRHVFILVPDRDAVVTERDVSTLGGAGNIDVVTFRRLSNFIFRSLGGICENYIGAGAKKVIMHGVLSDIAPRLHEYGKISKTDASMTEKLVKARGEMMRNDVSPESLGDAASRLDGKTAKKAEDLALIFSRFDIAVAEKWKDPDGMLSAATCLDGTVGFFGGTSVFIDAFTAFTKQQYGLIEKIFAGADSVTLSLAYEPDEDKNDPAFMTLENTDRILRELAAKHGGIGENVILREGKRYKRPELALVSTALWSAPRGVSAHFDEPTDAVRIISAADPYAEAEAVATDICRLVHGGMRMREIAVVVRSVDEYKGVIDAVLDKYCIPYFISEKTDISELSLIKFITAALSVVRRGFLKEDILSYIKTGLSGLTPEEIFALENYIIKWNISGKRFTEGDFVENPRGLGCTFTEADTRALDAINLSRRAVCEPLAVFSGVLRNQKDVRGCATVLFDFLSSLKIPEKLSESASDARLRGDISTESTLKKLWRAFCDALDSLVTSVGDRACDVDDFSVYLSIMLSETDIGRIPTAIDRVLIADAVLTSVNGARAVYVMGCYEGGFPRRVDEDGIFTEREKSELEGAGIEISSRLWKKLSDELYLFYSAVCSASEKLTVTYPRADMSGQPHEKSRGVLGLAALFPKNAETEFESTPPEELIWNESASFEYARENGGVLGAALSEYYSSIPEYADRMRYSYYPMTEKNCALDENAARALFGDRLSTSPSRLESYVKCRFAYFCNYELKLSDDRVQRFGAVDIGSFMHKIMEIAVKFTVTNPDATDEMIDAEIRRAAEEELLFLLRGPASKKLRHTVDYLCKSARAFVDDTRAEMAQSEFSPVGFELVIGDGGIEPMRLSNGRVSVKIRGKIDRVDACDGGDGTLRVVVVDYKTGSKQFELENVSLGLDMQMLLYLFSIWENGEKYFGKKTTPAGIVYVGIKPPTMTLTVDGDATVRTGKSGLFVSDIEILRAMDRDLEGKFIPVKAADVKKFNETGESKKLISPDGIIKPKSSVTN